jgi:predicted nucleotidyltransferase
VQPGRRGSPRQWASGARCWRFDYEKGKLSLFDLMEVKERAESIFGRKTDIMTRDSLHKTLRQRIEAAALQVF